MLFDAVTLDGARQTAEAFMTSDVTIETPAGRVQDADGQWIEGVATTWIGKGDLIPTDGQEKLTFDQLTGGTTYRLVLPIESEVDKSSNAWVDGAAYSVYAVLAPQSPDAFQKNVIVYTR